ncbi:tetratricopeptide repeat protein [Streptomyces bauhiniae]|uniref:tetratricopeptide repeat protein n=1 Tax=Streptomyces bauhiniae TaxID=2340725 RepID=UPI0036BA859C
MSERPAEISARDLQGAQIGDGGHQANTWHNTWITTGPSVQWPMQVGRPPTRPAAFQQRHAMSAMIAHILDDGGATVLTQVVATGGGGVGKTQLAANAFLQAREDGVQLLLWVNAMSRESIVSTFAQARIETSPGALHAQSADVLCDRFLDWLSTTRTTWLIVLDDVSDPADLVGLWPEGPAGRVLVTTRRRDCAPAGARQITVDVFTPEEAHAYFVRRLGAPGAQDTHPRVLDEAAELAEDLGRLPVALAQAAGVIRNQGITCAEYRISFAQRSQRLDHLFPGDASADGYRHTVATTWSLAVDRADQLPPTGLARPALYVAAVLDPNGAPDSIWAAEPVRRFLTTAPSPARSEVTRTEARAALRNLHRLNLVTHDPAGGSVAIRTHALVQRAVLDPLPAEVRVAAVRAAADALTEDWPAIEDDPEHSRVLRHNVAALSAHEGAALWQPRLHRSLFQAAGSFGELGLIDGAVANWEHLTATATGHLGADHPDTLAARYGMAYWLGSAGRVTEALQAMGELLEDRVRLLGPEHPETLNTRHNLCDWQGAVGDAAAAVAALRTLLRDRLRLLGPDHPHTLMTRHSLARWRGVAGDPEGAVREFERLVADRSRVLGLDHPDTLAARHALACFRGAAGDCRNAVAELRALLDDKVRLLGSEHPSTLTTRHDLACWQGAQGDVATAVSAMTALLEDRRRVLGTDHPRTLTTRQDLADWLGETGDAEGAAQALRALLEDRLRVLGGRHPDVTITLQGLAFWLAEAGRTDEAAAAAREWQQATEQSGRTASTPGLAAGPDSWREGRARRWLTRWSSRALQ